ncbi:hypothetical protein ACFQ0O_37560 [Saccharopolyspora spinosporotrichia]
MDDVVESYLVDGVVPARDVTCQGVGLPEPRQARTAAAKPPDCSTCSPTWRTPWADPAARGR